MLTHFATRSQKLTLVVATAWSVAVTIAAVASVAGQQDRISPGFVVWRNLVVPAVTAAAGDADIPYRSVLTRVNDRAVSSADELREVIESRPVGTEFVYRFETSARVEHRAIASRRLGREYLMRLAAPYLLNGLILLATALVVFYFKPWLPAAHAFLALAVTFGGMMLLALDAFSSFWLDRLCFTLDSLVPGALLHFALCFPEQRAVVRRRPALAWGGYALCLPLAALQNFYLTVDPQQHLRISDWVYTADAATALLVVLSLTTTFLRSQDPVARQQAKAVAAGFALAAIVPALTILSVTLFKLAIPFNPLVLFLLGCPLSIGYAIARHNLFEVDRFLRTGVVYGALSLIVFAAYAAIVLAGEAWLSGYHDLADALLPIYILVVLVVAEPLRKRIQELVDRLFYRQAYNYRATVERSSRELVSLLQTDGIARTLLDSLTREMAVEWAAMAVLEVDGNQGSARWFVQPEAERSRLGGAEAIVPALRVACRVGRAVSLGELSDSATDAEPETGGVTALREAGAVLVVPLAAEAQALGGLLLGEKRSGALYSDEDRHLLQTLANQSALALRNAASYEALEHAQQEVVRNERLAAVGELSATMAHGIRNPLAGIRVAAQVASEDPDDHEGVVQSLQDIISETDRLEWRVRAILDLARPFDPALKEVEPGELLRSFAAGIRPRLRASLDLEVRSEPGGGTLRVDPHQISEVLDILVVNAADAIPAAGVITLQASPSVCGDGRVAVALRVIDTGPGIDAARLSRIFDLFYTTKPSGTGVGLAMAKRLVERHGGAISVDSSPGAGTTFTLTFPIAS